MVSTPVHRIVMYSHLPHYLNERTPKGVSKSETDPETHGLTPSSQL